LPSSEASTCTRPRSRHGFGVGLGLVEGAADPDDVGDEVVVAAGVGVRRGLGAAVGDGVAPTPAQPARRIAAMPRPSNVLRDGLGRRVIRTPIEMFALARLGVGVASGRNEHGVGRARLSNADAGRAASADVAKR
jgi:hypothetical protein